MNTIRQKTSIPTSQQRSSSTKRRGCNQWWPGQWWPPMRWSGYYNHRSGNGGYHGGRRGAPDPGGSADHLDHRGHNNKAKDTARDHGRYPHQESAASMRVHHERRGGNMLTISKYKTLNQSPRPKVVSASPLPEGIVRSSIPRALVLGQADAPVLRIRVFVGTPMCT